MYQDRLCCLYIHISFIPFAIMQKRTTLWGLFIYDFTSQLILLASYFYQLANFSSQLILLASYLAHLKVLASYNQNQLEMGTALLNSRHFVFYHEDAPLWKVLIFNLNFPPLLKILGKRNLVLAGFELQTFHLPEQCSTSRPMKQAIEVRVFRPIQ